MFQKVRFRNPTETGTAFAVRFVAPVKLLESVFRQRRQVISLLNLSGTYHAQLSARSPTMLVPVISGRLGGGLTSTQSYYTTHAIESTLLRWRFA